MISACTRVAMAAGLLLALVCTGLAAPPASCESPTDCPGTLRTDRPGGKVNWATGQLEVVGIGLALGKGTAARQQARSTAFTILINEARRQLAGLQVDQETKLGAALADAALKKQADRLVAQIVIRHERWDEATGTYTIVGTLPVYGEHGLSDLGSRALTSFKPLELKMEQITITAPAPRGHTPQRFAAPYTGIIIDADACLLTPCLFPRIMRFDGKELWGPFTLAPAEVLSGPVRYAGNLETALQERLAGERPLILSAIGTALATNPVLNLDDIYLALRLQRDERIFSRLPIIITLGQQALPPAAR